MTNSASATFPSLQEMEQFPMDEVLVHFPPDDLDWYQL